jgi:hypothetical protein
MTCSAPVVVLETPVVPDTTILVEVNEAPTYTPPPTPTPPMTCSAPVVVEVTPVLPLITKESVAVTIPATLVHDVVAVE